MHKKTALVNGLIHTPLGMAEAVQFEGGLISRTGTTSDILMHRDAEVVDLRGRSVFPGFVDSHMHFMAWAESRELLDLSACRSIGELREAFRAHIRLHPLPESGWYRARGWNQIHMAEGRMPNRNDLDDLTPGNPLILIRVCGHVAALNSTALRMLSITRNTRIPGGVIELGEDGEPTGIVSEEAVAYVYRQIPSLKDSEMMRLLVKYGPMAAGFGLTRINSDDMSMFDFNFRRLINFYIGAEQEARLPFRFRQQFLLPKRALLLDFLSEGWRTGDGTPLYQIGPIKLLTDGSLGGRTALMLTDYADHPGERGVAIYEQEELNDLVSLAHSSGMQVAMHAIGDGGFEAGLNAVEAAQAVRSMVTRHLIVHAQIADDRQLERMKNLRLGAAIQPCFVPSDREMAIERMGYDRATHSYRWKTMLRRGIVLSAGSDAPIENLRPLHGIHAAVTRQNQKNEPEGGWNSDERLSVAEAIGLYTWNNAWSEGNEKRRGEIAPGQDADLVVLEQDPFLTPSEDLWKIDVAMTICGGRITHRSNTL